MLSPVLFHSQPVAAASPVSLSVYSEDNLSSNITDPHVIAGDSFNISILATNLPPFSGQDSGGISGFDITLDYNSTVLRALSASFMAPQCPVADNCIFDLPANDSLVTHQTLDSPPGTTRVAIVSLGPGHRPDLSSLQGQPAVLFRVQFVVTGKGLTTINIQKSVSQLLGFSSGCGAALAFNVADFSFDNRDPFRIAAIPQSAPVPAGQSFTTLVNVSLVNSAGYGVVNLTLSNYVAPLYTNKLYKFVPQSGSLNRTLKGGSFTSTLTINTNTNAPPGTYIITIAGVIAPPAPNYFQQNLNFPLTVTIGISPGLTPNQVYAQQGIHVPPTTRELSPDPMAPSLLASFTITAAPIVGAPVTFAAVAVWCSSSPYALRWDFGDGSSGTGNPASHTYSSTGTYNVRLVVNDTEGNSYTSTRQVSVSPIPQTSALNPLIPSSIATLLVLLLIALLIIRRRRRSR